MTEASTLPVAAGSAPMAAAPEKHAPRATSAAVEARLKELKRLREADLITEDVYQDQQRRALGLR